MLIIWRAELGSTRIEMDSKTLAVPVKARGASGLAILALLTTFAGVGLLIDRPKGSILEWLGVPFIVLGGAIFAWAVWPFHPSDLETNTLANRLLRWLTWDGKLVRSFPAIGVGMALADISYNLALSATPALQTEDTIVLLTASALIAYEFVPKRFARERDFALIFFLALTVILVLPLLIARLYYEDFEKSVDLYSWVALAPETGTILSVLGVANSVHPVAGYTAPGLTFTPKQIGVPVTIVITTACSGIYSFGIFAAAFAAFVLTEYDRPSSRLWAMLACGFLTAYVANVLRMVLIVLVGYYTDTAQTELQNLLIAHSYAGWIIFLGWIALFWGPLLKFLSPPLTSSDGTPGFPRKPVKESLCGICHQALTPAIPALRCECGEFHHRTCGDSAGRCPSCGRPSETWNALVPSSL